MRDMDSKYSSSSLLDRQTLLALSNNVGEVRYAFTHLLQKISQEIPFYGAGRVVATKSRNQVKDIFWKERLLVSDIKNSQLITQVTQVLNRWLVILSLR